MFGDFDDIFGNMDRMMNNMNSMMNGMMGGNMLMGSPFGMMNGMMSNPMQMSNSLQMSNPMQMSNSLQMMNNNRMNSQLAMFGGLGGLGPSNMSTFSMTSMPGQAVSYSSKVMTVSNDGTGKPQVYEQTSSQICGPNGVREIKETVKDSRTGLQQIKVGRHINDRGHIKQKKRNIYQGEEEEEEEFVNIEENDVNQFHDEFNSKTQEYRQKYHSIAPSNQTRPRLALTNGPSSYSTNQQACSSSQTNHNSKGEELLDQRPPSRSRDLHKKLKKKSKKPY